MNKIDLLALAARVEAAQGADRALDDCVAEAFGWPDAMITGASRHYTNNLSDAYTLARRLHCFISTMGDIAADGLPGVCLCISTYPPKHVWGVSAGGNLDEGEGRLARAMTAAALRAMADEAPDA